MILTVNTRVDFLHYCAQYGVDASRPGRPPVTRLRHAVEAAGDTLDASGYLGTREPRSARVEHYRVSYRLPQMVGGKVRRYSATGPRPELAGQAIPHRFATAPVHVSVPLSSVYAVAGTSFSHRDVLMVALRGTGVYTADVTDVSVVRV